MEIFQSLLKNKWMGKSATTSLYANEVIKRNLGSIAESLFEGWYERNRNTGTKNQY